MALLKHLAKLDIPGGGQVVAQGDYAFIGHMGPPDGTSIVDVSDPRKPRVTARIEVPAFMHSHKVRVNGEVMMVNQELFRARNPEKPEGWAGGIKIYDIKDKTAPREIGHYKSGGSHRFDSDERYAYISSEEEGYLGDIVVILDLKNPTRPQAVGKWHMPGQWTAGGETPTWPGRRHRCHHPLRRGDRLYTSYWHGGFVILDIADMAKPRLVSSFDWSPPFACPTHTTLPLPFPLNGRRVMLVADEDVARVAPGPPACLWLVDITDERHPMPFASFQVDGLDDGTPRPEFTACHQPSEKVTGTEIPAAWFAHGLRLIDIADPRRPREIGHFLPDVPEGSERVQSNDVTTDDRGLFYLLDRLRGLTILERC